MERILALAKQAIDEKKAINPVILDLGGISNITDYFLICSGKTTIQVRSIADNIIDKMIENGLQVPLKEGYHEGNWILLDFGNVVVHVMQETDRDFYSLENLWHDAEVLNL
ncbi:MAG TPA: ribosome silencing factor [Firmicutes bacterium]|jgi:ribosome-associated protein|nr:ribosome silencing factor [Bacillota bacterium]